MWDAMARLHRIVLAVAVATFAVSTQTTVAHADPPPGPPPASASVQAAEQIALTNTSAAMGGLMIVLDVLGIVEKNAPKAAAAAAHARTPIWRTLEAPAKPLLYSSLVVAKF